MKFSLFKNDKSTTRDEWFLLTFIVACLVGGSALAVTAPSFWVVDAIMTRTFGILWILVAVMFFPVLVYRLLTNNRKK